MKKPKHTIALWLILFINSIGAYSQDAVLDKRTITNTAITLAVTDHGYSTVLELNRLNKTVVETRYIQHLKHSEVRYNQYHTEMGVYKAFNRLGHLVYTVDNDKGTARLKLPTGEWAELEKPEPLVRSEALLRKLYGAGFVDTHVAYLPNHYFDYGMDTIEIKEHIPCPVADTIQYIREFELKLSNGKLSNAWLCVPFFLDTGCTQKIYRGCAHTIDFKQFNFTDSFDYYYLKARGFGLSRSKDYTVMNITNESCNASEFSGCSGLISLNIIEIMRFDTSRKEDNIIYNVYQFNPWTKAFLGKTTITTNTYQFLFEVIDFESEIYIHRFKDPLIPRPRYLDDLIRLFHIKRYEYILEP